MENSPPPKRLKLSVQVVGTSLPIQVTYEQGDGLSGIISATKAKLPDCLRAPIHRYVVSTDQQGRNPLDDTFTSNLEDNSPQNPLWLGLLEGE